MSFLALARGCSVVATGRAAGLAFARPVAARGAVIGRVPVVGRWKSTAMPNVAAPTFKPPPSSIVRKAALNDATPGIVSRSRGSSSSRQLSRRARALGLLGIGGPKVARLARVKAKTAAGAKATAKKLDADAQALLDAAADQAQRLRTSLALRFSNENSYLNWARNGVLSSAVGVAMYAQEHHRGAQLSGAGLLLLGFGYIGVGTAKYIYYILRFRQLMELSWSSVIGTVSHASVALIIWLTATASFLESVPLELDAMLLTEPIINFLPFRIQQGLIETYSLYLDDLEHHMSEQERVMRAIRTGKFAELEDAIAYPAGLPSQVPQELSAQIPQELPPVLPPGVAPN